MNQVLTQLDDHSFDLQQKLHKSISPKANNAAPLYKGAGGGI